MKNKLFSLYFALNIDLSFLFHSFSENVNVGNLSVLNASFGGFCLKENLIVSYNEKQWSASLGQSYSLLVSLGRLLLLLN